MSDKFKTTWFYASLSTTSQTKGLFRSSTEEIVNNRAVDFDNYAEELCKRYEELDEQGYDVINVVPIAMGETERFGQGKIIEEVGFSITRGAVLVGKLRDNASIESPDFTSTPKTTEQEN